MTAKTITVIALLGGFGLTACNTVEGVGRDISAGGKAVQEAADETRRVIQPQPPAPVYGY